MATPRYEYSQLYLSGVSYLTGPQLSRLMDIGDSQTGQGIELQKTGIIPIPDDTSMQVSAGSGLSVICAAGRGLLNSAAYGGCAFTLVAPFTVTDLPDNDTCYISATFARSYNVDGSMLKDTRRTGIPIVGVSSSPTVADGEMLAKVTTSGGIVTDIVDLRRLIPLYDLLARLNALDMFRLDPATTTGLTLGLAAGRVRNGSTVMEVASSTHDLDASQTDVYVMVDPSTGVISVSNSGFDAAKFPLYHCTTSSTRITSILDKRTEIALSGGNAEAAQDAVGGILTDTATIDLTYSDSTPSISADIKDNSVTDTKIGNRTVDPALATPANTGLLTSLLSWFAGSIKAIKGTANYYDAAPTSLTAAKAHADAAAPHSGHLKTDGSTPMLSALDMGGNVAANLADGVLATDAATFGQLTSVASGFAPRAGVRVATAAALPANSLSGDTLTATANGSINTAFGGIDGITDLAIGDAVLVRLESAGLKNGVYEIDAAGSAGAPWSMTRRADMDSTGDCAVALLFPVSEGMVNADTSYYLVNSGLTLDTDAVIFTQLPTGRGDTSTASNVGDGTGLVFQAKAGINFAFRTVKTLSPRFSVAVAGDVIETDVIEGNLDHANIGGSLPVAKGGTGQADIQNGEIVYGSGAGTSARLPPNSSGTNQFLRCVSGVLSWAGIDVSSIPVFVASGASHAPGLVPDPGATTGTKRVLREDATWVDLGLGNAATKDVGTTVGTVAAGNHTHADASGANDGFMSVADKEKLDALDITQAKVAANVATTTLPAHTRSGNVLTASASGALPHFGSYVPGLGDRALYYGVGPNLEFGLYDITDLGSVSTPWILTRSSDADTGDKLVGAYVWIENGDQAGNGFRVTTPGPIVINVTAIQWVNYGGVAGALTTVANDWTARQTFESEAGTQGTIITLGADEDALDHGGLSDVYLDVTDAIHHITGIKIPDPGGRLRLRIANHSAFDAIFEHEGAHGAGATPIYFPGGNDVTLKSGRALELRYEPALRFPATPGSTASRWMVESLGTFEGVAAGGGLLAANNLSDLASAGTSLTNLGGTTVGKAVFTAASAAAAQTAMSVVPGTDVASLVTGKVPAGQLPSYVDDVIEAANFAALPGTGEAGKIYVALDTNLTYRWSGSVYVQLATGSGVPAGGTTGQVLTKLSGTDGDADWEDANGGGGGGGGVTITTSTDTLSPGEYVDITTPSDTVDGRIVQVKLSAADDPLLYFNFDEGSGTTAANTGSASASDATLTNGVTWAAGRFGAHALDFDGVDDYVVASGAALPIGGAVRTACCWFKTTSGAQQILISYGISASAEVFALYTLSGNLFFGDFGTGVTPSPPVPVADGNWHFVALTYDGATANLYHAPNGFGVSLIGSNNFSMNTGASDLLLGSWVDLSSQLLTGTLDEVRVYNRVLSVYEINEIALANTAGGKRVLSPSEALIYMLDDTTVRIANGTGATATLVTTIHQNGDNSGGGGESSVGSKLYMWSNFR